MPPPDIRDTVADNVRALMRARGWSERKLADRSGVSQKTINKILNRASAPTITTLDRVSAAFGLRSWYLMIPDLTAYMATDGDLERLVWAYLQADSEGREFIQRVAEREIA